MLAKRRKASYKVLRISDSDILPFQSAAIIAKYCKFHQDKVRWNISKRALISLPTIVSPLIFEFMLTKKRLFWSVVCGTILMSMNDLQNFLRSQSKIPMPLVGKIQLQNDWEQVSISIANHTMNIEIRFLVLITFRDKKSLDSINK